MAGRISTARPARSTCPGACRSERTEVVAVADLAHFQVPMAKNAPAGWQREAHITFLMNGAGEGARSKFIVRAGVTPQ